MRTSNKILVALGAVIVVGLVILLATFRGFAGRVMEETPEGTRVSGSGDRVERAYDVEGFTGIESSGGWEVTLTRGQTYEVRIQAPEDIHDVLQVRRDGKNLVLGFKPGYSVQNARTSAEIVMPDLDRIAGSGGISCRFSGFSGDRLDVEISGGAFIKGSGGSYEDVNIDISGAAAVEMDKILAVNADVNLSGAGSVEITMDGGELTGSISGAGNLTYHGQVSRLDVEKSGVASISKE